MKPKKYDRAEIERVARIWRTTAREGGKPTLAVMTTLGITRSAAHRRIMRARELELLGPGRQGRTTLRNRKAEAIAEELGITYDALVSAVLKHADGDLRVRSI